MQESNGSIIRLFIWLFIISLWCMNLYKFATADFEDPYKTEIIRGIGVVTFIPGVIMGPMDIGEENER